METTKPITDEQIVNAISHTLIKGYNSFLWCVGYLVENEITKKKLIIENSRLHDETNKLKNDNLLNLAEKNIRLQDEIAFLKRRTHG